MSHPTNGEDGDHRADADDLPTAELTRPSPDAILADEADPDTLLGMESDSDAGSSRPVSMLPKPASDAGNSSSRPVSVLASTSTATAATAAMPDSDANSSRPASLLSSSTSEAAAKRASKRASRQLLDVRLGLAAAAAASRLEKDPTPTQDRFTVSTPPADTVPELRAQVKELTTQVASMNNKLVSAYIRIGDLEDDLSESQEANAAYQRQIAVLEKEREQHLAALNTGLLVEKENVVSEIQKMMDRVVQETAEKDKAMSDKRKIESELEELSSSLFSEANKMVASERLARAIADEKSLSMEERMKDTEEIMAHQQKRLTELQALVEKYEGLQRGAPPALPPRRSPAPDVAIPTQEQLKVNPEPPSSEADGTDEEFTEAEASPTLGPSEVESTSVPSTAEVEAS